MHDCLNDRKKHKSIIHCEELKRKDKSVHLCKSQSGKSWKIASAENCTVMGWIE